MMKALMVSGISLGHSNESSGAGTSSGSTARESLILTKTIIGTLLKNAKSGSSRYRKQFNAELAREFSGSRLARFRSFILLKHLGVL